MIIRWIAVATKAKRKQKRWAEAHPTVLEMVDGKQMNIDDCVNEFASSAAAQHDAIWLDADARKADRFADKVDHAFEFLRSQGDVGRDALMRLFFDSRPEVRVSAAAYLLRHCTAEALALLKREAAGVGMPAFSASQAIERWKDGTWSLDPL